MSKVLLGIVLLTIINLNIGIGFPPAICYADSDKEAVMDSERSERKWRLIEETYEVQKGDSIEGIAKKYIKKNTYGKRELHEFIEGIMELNEMSAPDIHVGDKLKINYWVKI